MNMADSNFFSSFTNPLTDGTGFVLFPDRGEVKLNEDAVLFGTQNENYEGCQTQNEATSSRFNTLIFDQPKRVVELLKASVNATLKEHDIDPVAEPDYALSDDYYEQVQKFYTLCMNAVQSGTVSNQVLNIRGLVRALSTVAEFGKVVKLNRWVENAVINGCPPEERATLLGVLKSTITL